MSALLEGGLLYLARRPRGSRRHINALLAECAGRDILSPGERQLAVGVDAALRRLGVRCLWRAAVVTEMLRRRGVAARVRLSVTAEDARRAHAESEVGGVPLRAEAPGRVVLR